MDTHELVSGEKAYQVAKLKKQKEPNKHIWESAANYQDQMLFHIFLNLKAEKVIRIVVIVIDKAKILFSFILSSGYFVLGRD